MSNIFKVQGQWFEVLTPDEAEWIGLPNDPETHRIWRMPIHKPAPVLRLIDDALPEIDITYEYVEYEAMRWIVNSTNIQWLWTRKLSKDEVKERKLY